MMKDEVLQLEKKIKNLKRICDQIDPYSPVPDKFKKDLSSFNIDKWNDPFALTNQLIVLLEDSIEKLEKMKRQ